MDQQECNGLQEIIDKILEEMRLENGGVLKLSEVNLAEFSRRSGLSRSRARTLKNNGFKASVHGRSGTRAKTTVMTGYEDQLNDMLRKGITNSSVCFDRLREQGYAGGLTSVKTYIAQHADLVPAKRKLAIPEKSRGVRYRTEPGESFQMDWGFVEVKDWHGERYKIACFAMVCHHCGLCYIEFFPNARQENLFIGMIHAFMIMGVPAYVLTDNMKSVVIRRDIEGNPIWQLDYAAFMSCIGFKTKLCKPRHPFTKGKVERLIRFVKDNFLAGRTFTDITQLNREALEWCIRQSNRYRRALDCTPSEDHENKCLPATSPLAIEDGAAFYLCPSRTISFDGFVCYEGRRFGVPFWYPNKTCRVNREGEYLHIYSDDLTRELAVHAVTWSRKDSFTDDQYAECQPYELPTTPVRTSIVQLEPPKKTTSLDKFDFERRLQ